MIRKLTITGTEMAMTEAQQVKLSPSESQGFGFALANYETQSLSHLMGISIGILRTRLLHAGLTEDQADELIHTTVDSCIASVKAYQEEAKAKAS